MKQDNILNLPNLETLLPSEARHTLRTAIYNKFVETGVYENSRNLKFTNALTAIGDQSSWIGSIIFDCYSEAEIEYRRLHLTKENS